MPGKKGVKLIPRRAVSGKYHSVRSLVFAILDKNPTISKEEVDKLVKKEYPKSNFLGKDGKGGHWTWYKHKWNKMKAEEAGFNIKDNKSKETVDEPISDESQKDPIKPAEAMDTNGVGKDSSRTKSRRVPIPKSGKRVDVKARKAPIQRKGSTKGS